MTLSGRIAQPENFMSYAISAAVISSVLTACMLWLIRRDQLYLRDAMFWLFTAIASIVLGLFPALVDQLGGAASVIYPPALVLAMVVVVGCQGIDLAQIYHSPSSASSIAQRL